MRLSDQFSVQSDSEPEHRSYPTSVPVLVVRRKSVKAAVGKFPTVFVTVISHGRFKLALNSGSCESVKGAGKVFVVSHRSVRSILASAKQRFTSSYLLVYAPATYRSGGQDEGELCYGMS